MPRPDHGIDPVGDTGKPARGGKEAVMNVFDRLRKAFRSMIEENSWESEQVSVRARALSPQEAIGNPEHRDYPLIKGRERMMQAEFGGSLGQAFTDDYGDFWGSISEVAALTLTDNFQRAVFLATLNAAARRLGLVTRTIHCTDDRPPLCAQELAAHVTSRFGLPRIAMLGLQPRMVEALAARFELRVTDLDEENIGREKFGVTVGGPDETARNLAWCDIVLATGTVLTNDTYRELAAHKPTIFYGVTVAAAAHLLCVERFCPYGS